MVSYMADVFYLAKTAAARLKDPSDTDFAAVFWLIFKTKVDDSKRYPLPDYIEEAWGSSSPRTASTIVREALESLANDWQLVPQYTRAHVRIVCDNGARYIQGTGNDEGWMYDPYNREWSQHFSETLDHVCKDPGGRYGASTTTYRTDPDPNDPTKPLWFSVIDLCDVMWNKLKMMPTLAGQPLPNTLDGLFARCNYDLSGMDFPSVYRFFPAVTILHEWLHAIPYEYEDTPTGQIKSGFEHSLKVPLPNVLFDPEPYAVLCLWAALADLEPCVDKNPGSTGGYTINRSWRELADEDKWKDTIPPNAEGETKNPGWSGILVPYKDITGTKMSRPTDASAPTATVNAP
ncbi:hypothetical protein QBC35DRAFT_454010 [Podospora australis]|uniref:Uncharacterized protein n=1 Tax=Podospora australis TaxID=1536484 RepID=A0AAN6WQQ5_9PEZI|nr:hypothetical protein QBC35DRAFT_454010 [Podospora australis]